MPSQNTEGYLLLTPVLCIVTQLLARVTVTDKEVKGIYLGRELELIFIIYLVILPDFIHQKF
jgi:hypothetical protein